MQITSGFVLIACLAGLQSTAALPFDDTALGGRASNEGVSARDLAYFNERAIPWGVIGKKAGAAIGEAATSVGLTIAAQKLLNGGQQQARELDELDARSIAWGTVGKQVGAAAAEVVGEATAHVGLTMAAKQLMDHEARDFNGLDARTELLRGIMQDIKDKVIAGGKRLRAREFDELDAREKLKTKLANMLGGGERVRARELDDSELYARALQWGEIGKKIGVTLGKTVAATGLSIGAEQLIDSVQHKNQARKFDELDSLE